MEREQLRTIHADIHNHSILSPDGFDQPMEMAEPSMFWEGMCRRLPRYWAGLAMGSG